MTRAEIAEAVEELKPRFFDGLAAAELKAVLDCARMREYPSNSIVSHEGHPADQLYLLISGRARFFTLTPDGEKILLFWVAPGEVLGGAAVLAQQFDYLLSTETMKKSRFLVWNRANSAAMCQRYPRLMSNALLIAHDYLVCIVLCISRWPVILPANALPPCWSTSQPASGTGSRKAYSST